MDKTVNENIINHSDSDSSIDVSNNLLQCKKHLQDSPESNLQLKINILDSSKNVDTTFDPSLSKAEIQKLKTRINSICNEGNPKIQIHKGMKGSLSQQIPTSFMFTQLPKKSINKFYEPNFLNTFSNYVNKYNNKTNDSHQSIRKSEQQKFDSSSSSRHRKFSEEEDEMLKRIVFTFGPKNWRLIASLMPDRTPRQCRDRYSNYLAPGFIHSEWTKEEDKLLAEKFVLLGPKWTQIRQYFPFRTANDIKNRYNYTVSRKLDLLKAGKIQNNDDIKNNINSFNIKDVQAKKIELDKDSDEQIDEIIELNPEHLFIMNDDFNTSEYDFLFIDE